MIKDVLKNGDIVRVTGNSNRHGYKIGDLVQLVNGPLPAIGADTFYWNTERLGGGGTVFNSLRVGDMKKVYVSEKENHIDVGSKLIEVYLRPVQIPDFFEYGSCEGSVNVHISKHSDAELELIAERFKIDLYKRRDELLNKNTSK